MGKPSEHQLVLKGIHVLYVDDHSDSREIMRDYLRYYGALVQVAESAQQALDRIRVVRPDIVITDLAMPTHGGRWLLREIRRLPGGLTIPVVALTAYDTRYGPDAMLGRGFDAYFTKPVSARDLSQTVARLVRQFRF